MVVEKLRYAVLALSFVETGIGLFAKDDGNGS
jgi:hypothetical protein